MSRTILVLSFRKRVEDAKKFMDAVVNRKPSRIKFTKDEKWWYF